MASKKFRKRSVKHALVKQLPDQPEVKSSSIGWPVIVMGCLAVSVVGGVLCAIFPAIKPVTSALFFGSVAVALFSVSRI